MRFYRLTLAEHKSPETAFSGQGATLVNGRWHWKHPDIRAVYCADSLALACLETLVHIRPLPRVFRPSVYFEIEIPDAMVKSVPVKSLPSDWNNPTPSSAARDFGTRFLRENESVGLVVPTAIQPRGMNLVLNVKHPMFRFAWISGPRDYVYDCRLA